MAVKTLKQWSSSRFLWEVGILSCFDACHENLSQLLDIVCGSNSEEHIGLVFQLAAYSLSEAIGFKLRFQSWECQGGFRELLSGLQHLHERKLIHTDIKPCNILLQSTSAPLVPFRWQLCDFGEAAMLEPESRTPFPEAVVKAAGTMYVTTEPYRAPELLCGLQDYRGEIDIWSLGVVF